MSCPKNANPQGASPLKLMENQELRLSPNLKAQDSGAPRERDQGATEAVSRVRFLSPFHPVQVLYRLDYAHQQWEEQIALFSSTAPKLISAGFTSISIPKRQCSTKSLDIPCSNQFGTNLTLSSLECPCFQCC